MNKDHVLKSLRDHMAELRALGVEKISVFGSTARGDAAMDSDVDLVVRLAAKSPRGFRHYGRIEELRERLKAIVGAPVDVVVEPVQKKSLREAIEKESAPAF